MAKRYVLLLLLALYVNHSTSFSQWGITSFVSRAFSTPLAQASELSPLISSLVPSIPDSLLESLNTRGISTATPIQHASFDHIFSGKSLALHSETGSGKTIAALLPVALRLNNASSARVLMLVPSRELALQLAAETEMLLSTMNMGISSENKGSPIAVITTGENFIPTVNSLETKTVIVATPIELCELLSQDSRILKWFPSSVQTVILDEVDLLIPGSKKFSGKRHFLFMDEGMYPTEGILKMLARRSESDIQVISCSATLDRSTMKKLNRVLRASSKHNKPNSPISICRPFPQAASTSTSQLISPELDQKESMNLGAGSNTFESSYKGSEMVTLIPSGIHHYTVSIPSNTIRKTNADVKCVNSTFYPMKHIISAIEHVSASMTNSKSLTPKNVTKVQYPNKLETKEDDENEDNDVGLVVLCASLPIKVRVLTKELSELGYNVYSLNDCLWPESTRKQKFGTNHNRFRKLPLSPSKSTHKNEMDDVVENDEEGDYSNNVPTESVSLFRRSMLFETLGNRLFSSKKVSQQGSSQKAAKKLKLLVTDQFRTRGLHLPRMKAVFIVGLAANSDTYLHLAGRVRHFPATTKSRRIDIKNQDEMDIKPKPDNEATTKRSSEPSSNSIKEDNNYVISIAPEKDLKKLRSWSKALGGVRFNPISFRENKA